MQATRKRPPVNPAAIAELLRQQSAVLIALAGVLEQQDGPTAADDLLTVDDAADAVNVTKKVIRRRIADGSLAATKPTGSRGWRILRSDLTTLFAPRLQAVKPAAPKPVRAAVMSEDDRLAAALESSGISLRRAS